MMLAALSLWALLMQAAPQTNEVVVPVFGKGAGGSDIQLSVDGTLVEVVKEKAPLRFVLLMDVSGSSRPAQQFLIKQVARSFEAFTAGGKSRGVLGVFNDRIAMAKNYMTADEVAEVTKSVAFRGGSAVIDAIGDACKQLTVLPGGKNDRKLIVLFTDGMDNASLHDLPDTEKCLRSNDISVLPVGILDPGIGGWKRGEELLKRLAKVGGTDAVLLRNPTDVTQTLNELVDSEIVLRGAVPIEKGKTVSIKVESKEKLAYPANVMVH